MEKFTNNNEETDVIQEDVSEKHGIAYLFEGIDPDALEELDHKLEAEGFSVNTIEDAFEYLESTDWNKLNTALKAYINSTNADEKDKQFDKIVSLIQ